MSAPIPLKGKKLGILISVPPTHVQFRHALGLCATALEEGLQVYAYCIDEATRGVDDPELQGLRSKGLILYACAYGAQNRGLKLSDRAHFAGLTIVNDLIAGTERFVSFHG